MTASHKEGLPKFTPFNKVPRLRRTVTVTEKIDGTNASVLVMVGADMIDSFGLLRPRPPMDSEVDWCVVAHTHVKHGTFEDGTPWAILAGSRKRWIAPFTATCQKNSDNMGFAAWVWDNAEELATLGPGQHFGEWWGQGIQRGYGGGRKRFSLFNTDKWTDDAKRPSCCDVVPIIFKGEWNDVALTLAITQFREGGSLAAPGYMDPEGYMLYHHAGAQMFKYTFDGDGHKDPA